MKKYIRTLTIYFDTDISYKEIPLFRGAVLKSLGSKANLLFHNHTGEATFRYAYPLIQYKRLGKKAAIVCINEGVDAIQELFSTGQFQYNIGGTEKNMLIESVKTELCDVSLTESASLHYRLQNWLPLNSDNYRRYQAADTLIERISILEEVLRGNILSMMKSIGNYIDDYIILNITDIKAQKQVIYKHVKLMAFDIAFSANITLPQSIGLGKSASVGFGTLTRINN